MEASGRVVTESVSASAELISRGSAKSAATCQNDVRYLLSACISGKHAKTGLAGRPQQ
jgi:hypothetical protein